MNKVKNKNLPPSSDTPDKITKKTNRHRSILPKTAIGWWALVASVIGVAAWVILPWITTTCRDVYPITDTWVMPAIGTFLIDTSAILNILAIWRWKERSLLSIVVTVMVVLMALPLTFIVLGEGIAAAG